MYERENFAKQYRIVITETNTICEQLNTLNEALAFVGELIPTLPKNQVKTISSIYLLKK